MAKKEKISTMSGDEGKKLTSSVGTYFTKEINDLISEMTIKEMEVLLKNFINQREWIAVLKYTGKRTPLLDATLRSIDPNQEPHKISWAQGALAGLSDLETYVIELNSIKDTQEESQEQTSTEIS